MGCPTRAPADSLRPGATFVEMSTVFRNVPLRWAKGARPVLEFHTCARRCPAARHPAEKAALTILASGDKAA
jgi:hypothetical protein